MHSTLCQELTKTQQKKDLSKPNPIQPNPTDPIWFDLRSHAIKWNPFKCYGFFEGFHSEHNQNKTRKDAIAVCRILDTLQSVWYVII